MDDNDDDHNDDDGGHVGNCGDCNEDGDTCNDYGSGE